MQIEEAVQEVQKKYRGLGWPSLFSRLKFYAAPFEKLAPLVPEEGLIVDLGCGYGIFANMLGMMSAERHVIGYDSDHEKIKYADRGIPNVSFFNSDITKTEVPPADCIILVHVLHHLPSYEAQERLVSACANRLKPGGSMIITEVDGTPRWKFVLSYLADHILYPRDTIHFRACQDFLALFQKVGIATHVTEMHYGALFPHITYICTKRI